jgi:hypothetical protein
MELRKLVQYTSQYLYSHAIILTGDCSWQDRHKQPLTVLDISAVRTTSNVIATTSGKTPASSEMKCQCAAGPTGLQIQTAMCRDVVHVTPCVDNSAFLNSYTSNCSRTPPPPPPPPTLRPNYVEPQNILQIQFHPHELNDLHSSRDHFRVIESRRIRCAGHVARVGERCIQGFGWET